MLSVFLLAVSLAVDATTAAICCGAGTRGLTLGDGVKIGLWFGGFQFLLSGLGGLFGGVLSARFWRLGTLTACTLLTVLGCRMVWTGLSPQEEAPSPAQCDLRPGPMALLALATSLDALAAGLSLTYLGPGLLPSALCIGLVTFVLSLLGGLLGRQIGQRWGRWAGAIGGLVLVGLALKLLWS